MGLNINGTKLLLSLHKQGLFFGRVLTIGRQRLNLSKLALQGNLSRYRMKVSGVELKKKNNGYCEPFLELLGATAVESMDISDYENATHLHDMNLPIAENMKSRFDTVIDSGSLEHVFNFTVAIRNCMEMLADGGHYIGITPANNFLGHGFYQFSPELFYRVFSEQNGFELTRMLFFLDQENTSFYEVSDPFKVRERVILNNTMPSFLFIVARKAETKPIFANTPQQSDYEHIVWTKENKAPKLEKFIPKPLRKMPAPLRKLGEFWSLLNKETGTGNPAHFRRVDI